MAFCSAKIEELLQILDPVDVDGLARVWKMQWMDQHYSIVTIWQEKLALIERGTKGIGNYKNKLIHNVSVAHCQASWQSPWTGQFA